MYCQVSCPHVSDAADASNRHGQEKDDCVRIRHRGIGRHDAYLLSEVFRPRDQSGVWLRCRAQVSSTPVRLSKLVFCSSVAHVCVSWLHFVRVHYMVIFRACVHFSAYARIKHPSRCQSGCLFSFSAFRFHVRLVLYCIVCRTSLGTDMYPRKQTCVRLTQECVMSCCALTR